MNANHGNVLSIIGSVTLVFILLAGKISAQDTVISLSKKDFIFEKVEVISLGLLPGWYYKKGNSVYPEINALDSTGWKKIDSVTKYTDLKSGDNYLGTWLRLKFVPDSSFVNKQHYFQLYNDFIYYLYLDDSLISFHGKRTEANALKHVQASYKENIIQTNLIPGKVYDLKIYFINDFKPGFLQSGGQGNYVIPEITLMTAEAIDSYFAFVQVHLIWQTVLAILTLLFWLMYFLNRQEKVIVFIALVVTFEFVALFFGYDTVLSRYIVNDHYRQIFSSPFAALWIGTIPILLYYIFTNRVPRILYLLLAFTTLLGILGPYFNLPDQVFTLIILIPAIFTIYITIKSWKSINGTQWIILAGLLGTLGLLLVHVFLFLTGNIKDFKTIMLLFTGFTLTFPLSLLVYVSVRYRNLLWDTKQKAMENIRLAEAKLKTELENKRILAEQNILLETQVQARTSELNQSLNNLKATQSQLIQSEKMASLGELTAGIAHEIQNPLNFVNNFSEVNNELIAELKEEINKGNIIEVMSLANAVAENEQKIIHHGKRADAIVKGMLLHSRSNSGQKEPTDINALSDEYLRLAYHGLRAKDKSFNATMKTDFDETIGNINIVPQDIGRVILNLITNAFYAVKEKNASTPSAGINHYEPRVSINTRKINDKIEIKVADNGNGIPQEVLDKIFQPFFTTKPPGQGTGLGLSLSYDIVKAHGGDLKVETKEGEGSEFHIYLPAN